jgi:hypothetical protein
MSFEEMFKAKGDDVKDAVRKDLSETVGDKTGTHQILEPYTDGDVMPPIEEKDPSALEAEAWLNANDPLRQKQDPDKRPE